MEGRDKRRRLAVRRPEGRPTWEEFRALLTAPLEKGFSKRFCAWVLEHDGWEAALQLAHDPDPRVAFRASAALEYAYFADPDGLRPYLKQFLANYLTAVSPSAHRHYAKILENLMRCGRIALSDARMQRVAEAAFDRLIDPGARPAVKVWSMEILFLLAPALPWVDEQLEESVRMVMDAGSPALDAHGARICRKIGKRRRR